MIYREESGMADIFEVIGSRKSVRTFDGRSLTPEDRADLDKFIETITNPFGVQVDFKLLDADGNSLSSPVITGEMMYVAGKAEKVPYADVAYGCAMEKLVLHAWSLGIGTTWIGGTMKRELFEKAVGLKEEELMPCISPLGYPAKKRSVREIMMRKGAGSDNRMSADRLFFSKEWGSPLADIAADGTHDLIEAVRWAPSAVNRQPWRIIVADRCWNFYLKHDRGYINDKVGDMQKIDIGIALCHLTSGMEEQGKKPEVFISDPGISVPEGVEYIASVRG